MENKGLIRPHSRVAVLAVWVVALLNGPQRTAVTNYYIHLDIELC